jgi:hypothetical protein
VNIILKIKEIGKEGKNDSNLPITKFVEITSQQKFVLGMTWR